MTSQKPKVNDWTAFGGWRALFRSKYLWWSLGCTVACTPLWWRPRWWDLVLTISPTMLGFALAAFALSMSLGSEEFREMLAGERKPGEVSVLLQVGGTFVHFVIAQCVSLGGAILAKSLYFETPAALDALLPIAEWPALLAPLGWGVAFWAFSYSVLMAIAAAKAVYWYLSWFDVFVTSRRRTDGGAAPSDSSDRLKQVTTEQHTESRRHASGSSHRHKQRH